MATRWYFLPVACALLSGAALGQPVPGDFAARPAVIGKVIAVYEKLIFHGDVPMTVKRYEFQRVFQPDTLSFIAADGCAIGDDFPGKTYMVLIDQRVMHTDAGAEKLHEGFICVEVKDNVLLGIRRDRERRAGRP